MKTKAICQWCHEEIGPKPAESIRPKGGRTLYYHMKCCIEIEKEWKKLNAEKEILQYKAPAEN